MSALDARQLNIAAKHRQRIGYLASLNDFTLQDGGPTDPRVIIDRVNTSLYCFDDAQRQAIFVELPPEVDLTAAPFTYQTQYERALRLIAVPYATFLELADAVPPVQRPIFVYITGRSGSTLLHHVFNASGVVASLAEPDVATQLVTLRRASAPQREPELRLLARGAVRFLFRSHHTEGVQAHALKLRSQGVRVMDLFQEIFPQARNIFLYRNAIGYTNSFYRLFRMLDMPEILSFATLRSWFDDILAADPTHLLPYLGAGRQSLSVVEQIVLWWISVMEWYLSQVARDIPAVAVRYEDLTRLREQVLTPLFSTCGLPESAVLGGLRAFERDSQAGSQIAREDPEAAQAFNLSDDQIRAVTAILERHPVLRTPDYVAPGTLQVAAPHSAARRAVVEDL
jgi:hypothetical protein